jgi:UDP-N-acetylmuramate dehydrogenase
VYNGQKFKITKLLYICDNLKNMPDIKTNYSLQTLNTFGVEAYASYFCKIANPSEIELLVADPFFLCNKHKLLILGGGSNLLFTSNYKGLVIQSGITGIETIHDSADEVLLRVGSGVEWDDLVAYAVEHQFGGIENLSGIPGNVGASPVQNIGAYGCEVEQVIEKVEAFHLEQKKWLEFKHDECDFAYRNSTFKRKYLNRLFVSHVQFRLKKVPHQLITHYGKVEEELIAFPQPTIANVREVVLKIRNSKLPDPQKIGNAGSFFKNPVIDLDQARVLTRMYPAIPNYPAGEKCKLSAAWLIDQSGLKGYQLGNAATHINQPLVIINKGNATGKEIADLAHHIQKVVLAKFNIKLEPEVNIL